MHATVYLRFNDLNGNDPALELARVFRDLAEKLEKKGIEDYPLADSNANYVGRLVVRKIKQMEGG